MYLYDTLCIMGQMVAASAPVAQLVRQNVSLAKKRDPDLSKQQLSILRGLTNTHGLSIARNELLYLEGSWYVTHSGLLHLASRNRCRGISVQAVHEFCEAAVNRWAFKATVYKSRTCRGFVGYGDADPSNVSPLLHGAEMRVAETRAVNRALRKAYGIGICSVEEVGSFSRKAPQPANGNGNFGGRTVRDRLCQLIRQHQLDAAAVKSYASDFCGVKALRDATREQVEKFVAHLAEQAEKDRNALVCQLNSYGNSKEGAA
jgi:hypothetical protein